MKNLEDKDEPSAEFDRYAHSYDELISDPLRDRFTRDPLHFHRRKWFLIERLLKEASADPAGLHWLDVGCGQGELLNLAGSHFAEALGCDPSAAMLPSDSSFKNYEQKSLLELPFADHSIDFVTMICVLHHVRREDRARLMDDVRRVLRPGGLCCIVEHNPWNPVTQAIVKRCPVDVDAELLTAQEAIHLLNGSSFTLLRREFFLYLPERLFGPFRAIERLLTALPLGGQYAVLGRASS